MFKTADVSSVVSQGQRDRAIHIHAFITRNEGSQCESTIEGAAREMELVDVRVDTSNRAPGGSRCARSRRALMEKSTARILAPV